MTATDGAPCCCTNPRGTPALRTHSEFVLAATSLNVQRKELAFFFGELYGSWTTLVAQH